MTPTSLRTYYLIATYGKRSALNITLNQSAAVQIANLRHYLPPNADRKDLFLGDYARKIHQLADLPVLRSTPHRRLHLYPIRYPAPDKLLEAF